MQNPVLDNTCGNAYGKVEREADRMDVSSRWNKNLAVVRLAAKRVRQCDGAWMFYMDA